MARFAESKVVSGPVLSIETLQQADLLSARWAA